MFVSVYIFNDIRTETGGACCAGYTCNKSKPVYAQTCEKKKTCLLYVT